MVAHPQAFVEPPELAARVSELGSVSAVAGEIEVQRQAEADPFRDTPTPVEVYDLCLAGRSVGQVVRDGTELGGVPEPAHRWFLVQKDADLMLAVRSAEDALERARRMVAARLFTLPRRAGDRDV